ncbi:MAG: tetraacyldisaccharide 4'-kinase [bacterium]
MAPEAHLVRFLQELWTRPRGERGLAERLVSALFKPLSIAYGALQTLRRRLFRAGILHSRRAPAKVVSIGGLRVGGVAKTPFAIWLARGLETRGLRAAVLTRGYGRRTRGGTHILCPGDADQWNPLDCGDEPYLMARSLPRTPIVVDSDRFRGAESVRRRFPLDLLLLDDGFQHLRLARDCDLVMLTGEELVPGACCLPAGPLREPASALAAADALILLEAAGTQAPAELTAGGRPEPATRAPLFRARLRPAGLFAVADRRPVEAARLAGQPIIAFCGIARPASFWGMLEQAGLRPAARRAFPDHHRYSLRDLEELLDLVSRTGSAAAVTTEKDAVKIERFPWPAGRLLFLRVEVALPDEERFWAHLLAGVGLAGEDRQGRLR